MSLRIGSWTAAHSAAPRSFGSAFLRFCDSRFFSAVQCPFDFYGANRIMRYHIWTIGCQMNVADSQQVAAGLERLGYEPAEDAQDADVMILNTCVVRQQPEDKAVGQLNLLKRYKAQHPERVLALMGCMVG